MATLTQSAKSTSKSNQDKNNSGQSAADTQSSTLVDNRPATLAQMKIADGMGNGPRANKIAQLQSMMAGNATMQKAQDEEEVQMKAAPIQKMENSTGLPDNLKSGVEKLSGESLNDVQVHRNSDQPAQMQAHAFAQGNQIHVAPGQEKHLPHEAWHVAQQKQGRVKPTTQMKGQIPVNDDKGLEHEADVMGAKALQKGTLDKSTQFKSFTDTDLTSSVLNDSPSQNTPTLQHKIDGKVSAVIGGDLKEAEEVVNSFSFGIPNAFKAEVEYNETTKEGKIEIGDSEDGKAFKGFAGQGTIEKEKEGPGWKGQISVSLPKTPEVKTPEVELPIPPIPTGIPGLWVQIGLSAQASASVGLAANVGFELDENKAPKKLSILSGTIEPKASAEATAKLTADLGVPGVATVGAGIYGTAKAELSSSLNMGLDIEKGLYATGEVAGGLTGEIGALVEAKVLGYNIASYKRPLFEKEVAKFKTVLNVSLNATEFVNALRPSKDSVKANANVKGDSVDAAASGDPNKIDDAAAEPKAQEADKKTGIISWLRSKF
jgi:hypothetical protein